MKSMSIALDNCCGPLDKPEWWTPTKPNWTGTETTYIADNNTHYTYMGPKIYSKKHLKDILKGTKKCFVSVMKFKPSGKYYDHFELEVDHSLRTNPNIGDVFYAIKEELAKKHKSDMHHIITFNDTWLLAYPFMIPASEEASK